MSSSVFQTAFDLEMNGQGGTGFMLAEATTSACMHAHTLRLTHATLASGKSNIDQVSIDEMLEENQV